ncbi:MAG: hypothetical protein UHD64_01010 [Bacteroidales bacterium]|nr:hypothetical protein [Bacteroidales bacterium]
MITSKITGKSYEPSEGVYISNPLQCQKYFKFLGEDFFLDILYTSYKKEDALVFVWKKCPETKEAKRLWDQHMLD